MTFATRRVLFGEHDLRLGVGQCRAHLREGVGEEVLPVGEELQVLVGVVAFWCGGVGVYNHEVDLGAHL